MTSSLISPRGSWYVVEHQLRRNTGSWSGLVLTGILGPILMFLALGFGLGSQIDDTSSLGTSDYLSFVGPGVLAGAALLQGGYYSLWPTMGNLKWDGAYQNIVRTPSSAADTAVGHLIWVSLRVAFTSTLYLTVLLLAIGWTSPFALLAPIVAGLTAWSVAAPVSAYTAHVDSETSFAVIARMVLTPLFVFSGTFTSVNSLPGSLQALIKITPGYHGIELCRGLINETISLTDALFHLGVVGLWIVVGTSTTIVAFRRNLTP